MSLCSRAEILVALKKANSTLTADEQAWLDLIQPLAEQAVKDEIGSGDIEYALHTEILPAESAPTQNTDLTSYELHGSRVVPINRSQTVQKIQLHHLPVWLAGLQVWEDSDAYGGQAAGSFGSDTLLTGGEDYYLDLSQSTTYSESGQLVRIAGSWDTEPGSIKVTYYGGWKPEQLAPRGVASNLRLAAIITAATAFNDLTVSAKTFGGAVKSETIGKYSVTYGGSGAGGEMLAIHVPPKALNLLSKFKYMGF